MTATLISLISILCGIIGANLIGVIYKKKSFGLLGNTIAGVFGCIFIIKSFGRLGFDPNFIIHSGYINYRIFALNCFVSITSGALALILISKLKRFQ